ncbi:hypothetical protein ACM7PC_10590 [Pseudomonas aeruginosa]
MSSTQHQLIEQCATRLRGIVEALDNIHDTSPQRWSTDLDDVHSSAESLLALINDQAPTLDSQGLALRTIAEYPCPEQDDLPAANMRQIALAALDGAGASSEPGNPGGEPVSGPGNAGEQAEAERPEVFGLERYRVEKTGQGFWPYCVRAGDGTRELFVGHLKQCKRVAAQLATAFEDGKFIAQHESIVGGLRAEITQLRQHKNDYMDAGQETYRALQNEIREREAEIARLDGLVSGRTAERDAALARVAELEQKSAGSWTVDTSCGRPILMYEGCSVIEDQTAYEVIRMIKWIGELERQEPVATVAKVPGEDWNSLDFHRDLQDMQPGTKFYAAPVAQAQQLHDLDKQCRDDVARALGLRPNQERGFAWSYLLASIKSCVKASEDSAQAQHSVPEGLRELLEMLVVSDLRKMRYAGAWRREVHNRASSILALLAAAPGNSVPQAWLDVQAERRRQVEAEGWTPEHDDEHSHGQMARAAACYALAGSSAPNDGTAALLVSLAWPWDEQWWKPSTARRDMVKACALGLAEIERLDRVAASQGGPSDA